MIRVWARAKINLCVEVLGRRNDGYHEIATVLQAIDLADRLTVEPAEIVSLDVDHADLAGPDNLVLRAANLLRQSIGSSAGAAITLRKQIPIAAGLGGGSADAAATLVALNELWHARLAMEDLSILGASLGSDVPFFLCGVGTAFGNGRGERVRPLPIAPNGWVALVVADGPPMPRKTARLYAMIRDVHFSSGAIAASWGHHLETADSWTRLNTVPGLRNAFDAVALHAFPWLGEQKARLDGVPGGQRFLLSGTGPTRFAIFDDRDDAARVADLIRAAGYQAIVCPTAARPLDLAID